MLQVEDLEVAIESLVAAGWMPATETVSGPGGAQQLVRRGAVVLEVFCARVNPLSPQVVTKGPSARPSARGRMDESH